MCEKETENDKHIVENIEKALDSLIFYCEGGNVHHCPNCDAKIDKEMEMCGKCEYSLKYIRELERKYREM